MKKRSFRVLMSRGLGHVYDGYNTALCRQWSMRCICSGWIWCPAFIWAATVSVSIWEDDIGYLSFGWFLQVLTIKRSERQSWQATEMYHSSSRVSTWVPLLTEASVIKRNRLPAEERGWRTVRLINLVVSRIDSEQRVSWLSLSFPPICWFKQQETYS